ncbi:MAG: HPr family phosphocarrier protein [Deltaproteobacteria bacterium HGW-Deltaproteobacteria-4]|nr:MAG: HPr family phosphocarrier protein [Deltaproteobacteria bacterium HGW-Deltaproteobacteria-4]
MIVQEFIIKNRLGLHARASAKLVQTANRFRSEVFISKEGEEVNGKSIMGILMLAAAVGTKIEVRVSGEDADAAFAAISQLIEDKFGED